MLIIVTWREDSERLSAKAAALVEILSGVALSGGAWLSFMGS
jgi:hypothetical protein